MATTFQRRNLLHHGIELIRGIDGKPSHRLEIVSVPSGSAPPSGFQYHYGWISKSTGQRMSEYTRRLPLAVEG